MEKENIRYSGILMHVTSLPGRYGIGTLGDEAYKFADQLRRARVSVWQMLPFGPTGFGNSPYAPRSSFAGNELFIDLDYLVRDGWLTEEDLEDAPSFRADKVEFDRVIEWKMPLLKKAAEAFLEENRKDRAYTAFKKKNALWLDDYAAFMVLYEKYYDARWFSHWDECYAKREAKAMRALRKEKALEIEVWCALQYFFDEQWHALKTYCNEQDIKLFGDIPIFVGADSADTWSHLELFKTDSSGRYSAQAGVPPDGFCATGQLWGNPVYDWKEHERTNFAWWIERLRRVNELVDFLRIDHFRGLDAYYEIKAGAKTAENGKWVKSPGKKLFKAVKDALGDLPIIAEDLGVITESVEKLRDSLGFPGMKVAQFGFYTDSFGDWDPTAGFLPHNYEENFVAYTGTHDNDTTRGWFDSLSPEYKHIVREYLWSNDEEVVWNLMRAIMQSHARFAIFPMQDVLDLGSEAKMNYPSSCNDTNWSWRLEPGQFEDWRIDRFAHMSRVTGRTGLPHSEIIRRKEEKRRKEEEEARKAALLAEKARKEAEKALLEAEKTVEK